ncbi:AAA family ATPase [Roseovarius sp. S4756]|uniref:AAA family ATPase n=1 Tax=Roseovarius maritimus TaxID=3342637 RepID=UPI00372A9AF5
MPNKSPMPHMPCGKIAAGKSTLAAHLGSLPGTVRIAEDDWFNAIFAGELHSITDNV